MRKLFGAVTAISVLATLALGAPVQAKKPTVPVGGLTYDGYLQAHDADGAFSFVKQQATQTRLAAGDNAGYDGDYGHKGCTVEKKYEVGDEEKFWVSPNVANMPQTTTQITAVLAEKSPHGYLWVQKEYYLPTDTDPTNVGFVSHAEAVEALSDWDKIYPTNRTYFGSEPNKNTVPTHLPPGLPKDWRDADCDNRIHILNFPIDTPGASTGYIAGYYSSEHEYPNGKGENASPFSNEKEMFFMNSAMLDPGSNTYSGVLAHEFFHMIQFGNDFNEATWVNEGMADVAAVVNGFSDVVQGHIDSYSEEPDASLFDWTGDVSDYGQAFLFFDYFFNHYGRPENAKTDELEAYGLAKLLTKTPADSDKGVTKVIASRSNALKSELKRYYRTGNFKKVFKDYLVANYLDLPDAASGQFGYANREVAVAGAGSDDSSPADSTVHPYGGEYYELTGSGKVQATAEDPVAVIPAQNGQPKGKYFAWSNRADEMITWLQRSANLTEATNPQLVFKYWYQIEEDWDYAYVLVSTNNGRSWHYQNTGDCGGKATDPNGNNRATTESGGITGDSDGWQTCTLDLAQYAGKKVLIRFEYDTDQATTEAGYVVDNVKVVDGENRIWGPTTFEKPNPRGWTFGGDGILEWLRMKPTKRNQPLYQIVSVDGSKVRRKAATRRSFVKNGDHLEFRKPKAFAGEKTVLVFSATTPIATEPFGYSYNVTRN